jgi:hypothetical protein
MPIDFAQLSWLLRAWAAKIEQAGSSDVWIECYTKRMTHLLLSAALLLVAASAAQAESITTQMFDARDNRVGSATQTGDITIFYDARGNKTGSSADVGSRTNFYDARGNPTGSVRNGDRKK